MAKLHRFYCTYCSCYWKWTENWSNITGISSRFPFHLLYHGLIWPTGKTVLELEFQTDTDLFLHGKFWLKTALVCNNIFYSAGQDLTLLHSIDFWPFRMQWCRSREHQNGHVQFIYKQTDSDFFFFTLTEKNKINRCSLLENTKKRHIKRLKHMGHHICGRKFKISKILNFRY